ncbi:MAG: ABC transporter ATP-binding protein [Prevotella sp.]|jgi:ABC-type multidrug transport system ATPase subunit|nr:ABC transporter ATP-binding protein [Prevotella sp.]MDR2005407.1 ABC transporter ATP-binding protein [Prevotella sp.]
MGNILDVRNISYKEKNTEILHNVSLKVEEGQTVALLGHNGAGKSTLIDIICELIKPVNGQIYLFEKKRFKDVKKDVGILWDSPVLIGSLKVKELIRYLGLIYNVKNTHQDNYSILGIDRIENRFFFQLSKGEKKRVAIYILSIYSPKLLILDEPTAELDPFIRSYVWENIFNKRADKGILFSTHHWDEVQLYADIVYFISEGRIIEKGHRVQDLLNEFLNYNKISVNKEQIDISTIDKNIISFYDENNLHLIVEKQEHSSIIKVIQNQTFNFSIMPVELKDIYQILIRKL